MLLKIAKSSVIVALAASTLSATAFNAQAEKDRHALRAYMEAKFANPETNGFFPNSTSEELKAMRNGLKADEFAAGTYAWDLTGKISRDDQMEMPPFEDNIDKGEELYNKYIKSCLPNPAIVGDYPQFNEKTGKVDTLSEVILSCVKAQGLKTGKKAWNLKGGLMADVQSYMSTMSQEAEKTFDIRIPSAKAAAAYENGKEEFYSQRGYFKLSCATCHVAGSGKRVRLENLSTLLGDVTHFPVYRIGKGKLFTLEGRLGGCNRNMGEKPHKPGVDWSSNVLYFMSYMANGMPVAQDVRR